MMMYLGFGHFVSGQFDHSEVALPQRADDLIEAHLQGPTLSRHGGLTSCTRLSHDHHTEQCVQARRPRLLFQLDACKEKEGLSVT